MLEFLSLLKTDKIALENGKIYIIGDTLSRAPHVDDKFDIISINKFELVSIAVYDTLCEGYSADPTLEQL